MAFQPFGYRFEVTSILSPEEVKAAIRSRKKHWFEVKSGARGWIVGPFVCLWLSAFNNLGPSLIGRISRDNLETRISGRAGSDLGGLVQVCLLVPVMAWLMSRVAEDKSSNVAQEATLTGFVIVIFGLVFWSKHVFRRDAEPLVRFLQNAVTASKRKPLSKGAEQIISKALSLNINGNEQDGPVTRDAIHDALFKADAGDFVILAETAEIYVQTASKDGDGYILEKREGNSRSQFHGVRRCGVPSRIDDPQTFTFEEVCETFLAFASGASPPHFLRWERGHSAR